MEGMQVQNNKFDSPDVDITFYFKEGKRTKDFDNLMVELSKLVNEKRKQRLSQKKEEKNDDKK